jgi:hypothetical protein
LEAIFADANLLNADWTKQSWDLDANTVEKLREYLESTGQTVERFKSLPVYRLDVDKPGMEWLKEL